LNVTGPHYPPPGVQVTLHRPYIVIDVIDTVKLRADRNNSALHGNFSKPVKFIAR